MSPENFENLPIEEKIALKKWVIKGLNGEIIKELKELRRLYGLKPHDPIKRIIRAAGVNAEFQMQKYHNLIARLDTENQAISKLELSQRI
ncbi:MAG: hypothetical protein V1494_02655 [Candidatus Diapherotrites archaeon]